MVSTFQIKPTPILQPFISCYALRVFNSENGLLKAQHAQPDYYLSFLLRKEKQCSLIDDAGNLLRKLSGTLCTLYTQSQGAIFFKGNYSLFSVLFRGNGLFAILGIPQKILIDSILPLEDILGNDYHLLEEQLESSNTIQQMGTVLNTYLIKKLITQKHSYHTNTIASVANEISNNNGIVLIEKLAYTANMSIRNFERRFINEVGIPAKLYMRIIRFSNAVQSKMICSEKNWTEITYENGYYDQSHFIKDCREFSSKSPEELFKYTPPPKEDYINLEI